MNNRNSYIVGILSLVVAMVIGYALFSETVTIGGTAKGEGNLSLIFSSVGKTTKVGTGNVTTNIKNAGKNLDIVIDSLDYPSSYVEIPIKIKNNGTIKAVLNGITPNNLDATDIKVSYREITETPSINPEEIVDMIIRVEWYSKSVQSVGTIKFNITLDYIQYLNDEENNLVVPSDKKYAIGEKVCIKDECFNVIKDNGDTVDLFAKQNIDLVTHKQSPSAGYTAFSKLVGGSVEQKNPYSYWADGTKPTLNNNGWKYYPLLDKYGGDVSKNNAYAYYPKDVYPPKPEDEKYSLVHEHVIAYNNYIKSLDISSVYTRLISYNELKGLGCISNSKDGYTCNNSQYKDFLVNGKGYWSASVRDSHNVLRVSSSGDFHYHYFWHSSSLGVRPVITISKTELSKL